MISLAILGGGNVAYHLTRAFSTVKEVQVTQINSRIISDNFEFDVVIIAVSDAAISEVSKKIQNKNTLVVHTSGCESIQSLCNKGRKGVFYPLQTFSKNKEVDLSAVPFCLEAENEDDFFLLEQLAKTISKKTYQINSEQRRSLHVSAVFVNNFVNHFYKIGNDICNQYNVPFEILFPLIKETANKLTHLSPKDAQTGPAVRNDIQTIQNHLKLLNDEQQELYKIITKSIQNGYKL